MLSESRVNTSWNIRPYGFDFLQYGMDLLADHQSILQRYPLFDKSAYWNFTNKNRESTVMQHYVRNFFEMRVGSLANFSDFDISAWLEAAISAYKHKDTFGNFPFYDHYTCEKLLVDMITGFHGDELVVFANDKETGRIAGGVMAIPGNSEESVAELIGNSSATLPTIRNLKFSVGNHPVGLVSERQLVCYTRYFIIVDGKNPDYQKLLRREIRNSITHLTKMWSETHRRTIRYSILDTNNQHLILSQSAYAAEALSVGIPTNQVINGPHRWHYESGINTIMIADFVSECEKADTISIELGNKLFL